MAAEDSLTPRQFHGTNQEFKPGDTLLPRNELKDNPGRGGGLSPGSFVWSTTDPRWPGSFGKNVYEVQHEGMVNKPPNARIPGSHVSLGAKVVKKVSDEELYKLGQDKWGEEGY